VISPFLLMKPYLPFCFTTASCVGLQLERKPISIMNVSGRIKWQVTPPAFTLLEGGGVESARLGLILGFVSSKLR